jgi:hypothetical protein
MSYFLWRPPGGAFPSPDTAPALLKAAASFRGLRHQALRDFAESVPHMCI